MKTLKINKLILLFIGLVVFNGCVEDDDFNTPNTSVTEPQFNDDDIINPMSSVAGQVSQEQGSASLDYDDDETIYTYPGDSDDPDTYISGYVVSSDEGGNFFEELIIQDLPENPTIGIRLRLDVNPLFTRYEVGRKVFIKLNGLSAGISSGVLTIGTIDGQRIGQIATSRENDVLVRTPEVATIVPLPLAIEDLIEGNEDKTNLMIELSGVQFKKSEAVGPDRVTYASEAGESFDAERTLESCASSAFTTFATSTFADFKGLFLPSGSGSMVAVLQRDFFGEEFNINVNSPENINFDSDERCDPFDINDFNVIFEEDFTDGSTGWEIVNTVGTKSWEAADFGGDFYIRGSAFTSGSPVANMVSWLISPAFDFDNQTDEQLVLEIADAFSDAGDEPLKAYYSNDYVVGNDPSTSTWTEIGTNEIESLPINTGFFDNEFDATNLIDLSAVTGNAFIAFVYDSNNATISSTRDLGNVKILSPQ